MTKAASHGHEKQHGHKAAAGIAAAAAEETTYPGPRFQSWQRHQDADHIASLFVDRIVADVEATIQENRVATNTFKYTGLKLVNGLIYMMSMVTIDLSTKFKDNPATYEAGAPPETSQADIWSKHFIKAKKKRKSLLAPYGGLGMVHEEGESDHRSIKYGQGGGGGRRSPDHTHPPILEDEITMSVRDLAFKTVAVEVTIPPDELVRRKTIEHLLDEREKDEALRRQAHLKRVRTVAKLVIEPVDGDAKKKPSDVESPEACATTTGADEQGASEVILVEAAEMIVGADSHLVSRRSKQEMLKHLPSPVFEPTVVLPPPNVVVATARTNPPNSRGVSRNSMRAKTPKTPGGGRSSRARSILGLLGTDARGMFIEAGALDGGPCFDNAESPAKGVVIKQGLVVKAGEQWEHSAKHMGATTTPAAVDALLSRTTSEPALAAPMQGTLTRQHSLAQLSSGIPEDEDELADWDVLSPLPLAQSNSALHPLDHHRHANAKSMNLRIRTPACRKRRSRKLVDDAASPPPPPVAIDSPDGNNADTAADGSPSQEPAPKVRSRRRPSTTTTVEPQKLVRSPLKKVTLPTVGNNRTSSRSGTPHTNVTIQNPLLTLPLLRPSS
ncbi:Aste57867_23145 [Aphanomyces stellatus]|uniref:Aste57867_23145 protein n=1 Tax=Aphanomyces stellatus TaxID=120398 RepID=A0A485LRL5_9STRA|nr:hypothetical protein As57867_023074 [Aphanomyces stellatus]VFT99793.1 Aste57867_23145 [Aphanomyces stellatus]